MKTSGRVLATALFAVAASGYAGISSAGPHGGAMGFHGLPRTNGIAGTGSLAKGIAGTGSSQKGVFITGSRLPFALNGIAGTGSLKGIAGTGSEKGIAGTGSEKGIAGTGSEKGIAGTGSETGIAGTGSVRSGIRGNDATK